MAIEDILKDYDYFNRVRGIKMLHAEKGKEAEAFEAWIRYRAETGNLAPEQVQGMRNDNDLQVNLVRRGNLINSELERKVGAFAESMQNGYKDLVAALPEEYALSCAMDIPDKDKKYRTIQEAVKKGDLDTAKKAYADLSEDIGWKEFVMTMPKPSAVGYIEYYVAQKERQFIESKLSEKVTEEKDGKKKTKYVPNLKKIQDYIISTIESYGEESAEGFQAYEMLVQTYQKYKEDSKKKK